MAEEKKNDAVPAVPSANAADDEKLADGPTVLVLGGCGFIGRHLVQNLMARGNVNVVVADKLLPQTGYMTEALSTLFGKKGGRLKVVHSDLSKDHHIKKLFVTLGLDFDFIVNLCGETRFGQSDNDYKLKCVETCKKTVIAASNCKNLKMWVEVSTAQCYEPAKKPLDEKAKMAPFTNLARHRVLCEQLVQKSGLPYMILRPSIVYGPGDKSGLTPRLVCCACSKHKGEAIKFLWTPKLAINTVHVRDLCNAIWLCLQKGKSGAVYNVSDRGQTTQESLNKILEKIFGIKCGFQNSAINKAAKNMMAHAAQHANDTYVPLWSDVCKEHGITNSPLTPYIDQEILTKNYLCIDGMKIEKELGFQYKYPKIDVPYVQEVIDEYVQQQYFPDLTKMK